MLIKNSSSFEKACRSGFANNMLHFNHYYFLAVIVDHVVFVLLIVVSLLNLSV